MASYKRKSTGYEVKKNFGERGGVFVLSKQGRKNRRDRQKLKKVNSNGTSKGYNYSDIVPRDAMRIADAITGGMYEKNNNTAYDDLISLQ